ncbi:MAG: carboxypeptidase regulatory-like domain-containing protein [Planctomycetes bacterium]|nr:carboxypeptidase regulatory-like domain-containing protein [Planctomycetota bacterium]
MKKLARLLALGSTVLGLPAQQGAVTRDLAGTVAGAPAGERVLVTLWHDDMERDVMEPLGECFAATDGTFAFAGTPWFERQQWGSHHVLLLARAGDHVAIRDLRGDDVALDRLDLALAPAVEVRGRLCDGETRAPIAGAWVWPAILGDDRRSRVWLTQPLLPWHATTAADGTFVLKGLPDLAPMKLLAGGGSAAGRTYARSWVDVEDRNAVLGLLELGGSITGRVLLPDGSPARRVPVTATGRAAGLGRALTGDDGTFTLSALPPDTYKVFARAPDLTVIAVLDLEVGAGDTIDGQQVRLVEGGFVVGRIVDAATGKPFVPGPWTDVAMYGPARGPGGSCECTPVLADGTFRIRAPAGRNRVYLRSAGGYTEPSSEVDVVEGQETEVVWQVRKGR